ncbi:MAG: hypothetical protein FWE23_10155 [Chitinivibrionia bacterium]|nr:hypothetical protein [Chitinivibrionia bacterium]
MKKILIILLCAFALSFACRPGDGHNHGTRAPIFSGAWCVVDDDLRIDFIGADSVKFTSESDPSVNGSGKFSFDDTHLRAELQNSGMTMKIVYKYTQTPAGLRVITELLEVNGSAINANPDPIALVRCRQ